MSDGPVAPSVCFDDCNNAYKEALAFGKVPELCEPGSLFNELYAICFDCIETFADGGEIEGRQYLDERFSQFIDFCELPRAVIVTGTFTLRDGQVTIFEHLVIETQSATTSPPSSSESLPTSSSWAPSSTGPSESQFTGAATVSPSNDQAWIAGAVIGPLAALGLIAIAVFHLISRRRRRHQQNGNGRPPSIHDKAQLHSDSLPAPSALKSDGPWEAGSRALHEMEGSYPPHLAEMKANEVPAKEMEAPHKPRA